MTQTHSIIDFWSTLITEKGLTPHVESLMKVPDIEERGLSLLSRVNFLWCMGIKYQRDIVVNLLGSINKELNTNSKDHRHCNTCSKIKTLIDSNSETLEESSAEWKESKSNLSSNTVNIKRKKETSSENIQKRLRKDKENIDTLSGESVIEILAPETEKLSQGIFHASEDFIIPETIALDDHQYGNTDFFLENQHSDFCSPQMEVKTSPILGKSNKGSVTPTLIKAKRTLNLRSPKKDISLSSSNFKVNSIQASAKSPDSNINSPSLLDCNLIERKENFHEKNASASPFREKQNLKLDDKYDQSKTKSLLEGIDRLPSSSFPKVPLRDDIVIQTLKSPTKKLSKFPKSKSELCSLTKISKLNRIKTLNSLKSSKLNMEIEIGSPRQKQKTYRQTKITSDGFLKKTDVAKKDGGKEVFVNKQKSDDDDDDPVSKAVRKSIRTKAVEDILKNKHKELEKERLCKLNSTSLNKGNKTQDEECLKRLKTKDFVESPKSKAVKNVELGSSSATQLTEDEILDGLKGISESQTEIKPGERLKRNRKKVLIQDSFDILPGVEEPEFAHRGEVVRKKSERQKLDGWDCHECRDYYEGRDASDTEIKVLRNKCSRHRSKYKPVTNTPEGFWVVGFDDD